MGRPAFWRETRDIDTNCQNLSSGFSHMHFACLNLQPTAQSLQPSASLWDASETDTNMKPIHRRYRVRLRARWHPRHAFRFPHRDSKRAGKFAVDAGARREALDMYPRACRKPTDTVKSPARFERNAWRIFPANGTLPSYHQRICPAPPCLPPREIQVKP